MANIKDGTKFEYKLKLPKDFHWKVYGRLLTDLGFNQATSLSKPKAFLSDIRYSDRLHRAVRHRDALNLLDLVPELEPRCMLEFAEKSEDSEYLFFAHYQASAFLKKFPFKVSGINREEAATDKFYAAEDQCRNFNLHNHLAIQTLDEKHPQYYGILDEMREDIRKLLGEQPPIDSIFGHAKHGPGVSLGDLFKDGRCTEFYKWRNLPYSVTSGAVPLAKTAIASDPRWIGALDDWYRREYSIPVGQPINVDSFWSAVLEVVDGNRITTVPKTAVTDRTIAIEPVLNVYMQLGVDYVIRRRLAQRWGYDLNDQSKNQELAKIGARDGSFATLDLSAASDTISLKICEMLLPPAWLDLLLDLRSPIGELDGEVVAYEKLSSMGNGYTFAIESVIFAAISRCAIRRKGTERESAVYGDDIVIPTQAASYAVELLQLCGFETNKDKSFVSGPFRESCGCDYFRGTNVRPVYLKRPIRTVQDLFYLHNVLLRLQNNAPWYWCLDFSDTLKFIRKYIPKQIRDQCSGPVSESLDTYLHAEEKRLARDSDGLFHLAIVPEPVKQRGRAFFFRKLMVALRARLPSYYQRSVVFYMQHFQLRIQENSWDIARRLDTGNAFDVTRRGRVSLRYRRVQVYRNNCLRPITQLSH